MSAPVRHTCPDIDQCLALVQIAIEATDSDAALDALEQLAGRHGYLEDLRSSNNALREWGHKLEAELEMAHARIDELQAIIEGMERQQ